MTGPAGAGLLAQSQATQKQIKIKITKTVRPNDTAPRSPGNDCSLSQLIKMSARSDTVLSGPAGGRNVFNLLPPGE